MEVQTLKDILLGLEKSVKQLEGITGDCTVTEIGDGNINFVYRASWTRATDQQEHSVIVKFAPKYIRCLGPEYGLTQSRLSVEHGAMCCFQSVVPDCCPKSYYFSQEHSVVIMEDLKSFALMRMLMSGGEINTTAACSVAKIIGQVHRHFRESNLSKEEWQKLCLDFDNKDMVDITRQYVFVRPYDGSDPTNKSPAVTKELAAEMRQSDSVMSNVASLRKKFVEDRECLLHGDLHIGSVLTCGNSARVFDMEFACIGPAAFEVGMFLIQFAVSWLAHRHTGQIDQRVFGALEDCMRKVWYGYKEECFAHSTGTPEEEALLWRDAIGFGACEATRRVIGAAPIPELSNDASLLAVLKLCYRILSTLDEISTVDQLIEIVQSLA